MRKTQLEDSAPSEIEAQENRGLAPPSRVLSALKVIGLIGTIALFLWVFLPAQYASYLAPIDPERALEIDPDHPVALVELAERTLTQALSNVAKPAADAGPVATLGNSATDDSDALKRFNFGRPLSTIDAGKNADIGPTDQGGMVVSDAVLTKIEDLAKRALARSPLNVRAVVLLGQVADFRKDKGRAFQLMSHAAELSIRASGAQYWLLDYQLNNRNFEAAARHADILLRTRPSSPKIVVPVLARMAEDTTAAPFVDSILVVNPPWRRTFFSTLSEHVRDRRTPLKLLLAAKEKGIALEPIEVRSYLNHLLKSKEFDLAQYVWLQFLSSEELQQVGLVFDGDFNLARSTMPFDWTVSAGTGFTADFIKDDENPDNAVLQVEFSGSRVEGFSVRQQLMLRPGRYAFRYKIRGEVSGRRGLVWRVVCPDKGGTISESPMFLGAQRSWREQTVEFTVPEIACPSQTLILKHDSRSPSEEIVAGLVAFDSLSISPVGDRSLSLP